MPNHRWFVAAAVFIAGCHGPLPSLEVKDPGDHTFAICDVSTFCAETISLQYLGVAGFVIRSGPDAVMTAPEFTHPALRHLASVVPSNARLVDSMFRQVDTAGVRTILVGHSHYDHLMDVPTIVHNQLPKARVISTPTTMFTLASDTFLRDRIDSISVDSAGTRAHVGQWRYIKGVDGRFRFRVMAVVSTHAPNIGFPIEYTIADDTLSHRLDTIPAKPWWWPKGQVYAYVIDVISRDSTPLFRVFYQDAASDPEHSGLPPFRGKDARRTDVAILCAGNFDLAYSYPTVLLRELRPRFALIGHWEDFFRGPEEDLKLVPFLDGEELKDRVREFMGGQWATLRPFSVAHFLYTGAR